MIVKVLKIVNVNSNLILNVIRIWMIENECYGEASNEDVASLMKTLEMLRNKRNELVKQRDSLIQNNKNVKFSIQQEENKKDLLVTKINHKKEKASALPDPQNIILAQELKEKLKSSADELKRLKQNIIEKEDEKKTKMEAIYNPQSKRSIKKAINFLHQSLLDELSEQIQHDENVETLQKKEKQIQLCENLMSLY
ncbi:myosin-like antigen [Tritrichomonas foetus]|uniref:Myosin-like antigen n=1 Tax=Tritrichomonas foetus TaxID=1144522 RepID=A0A1J4KDU7_9EUKA|nr:myosin-like antigen [Tritrichomonas foetus]|eukprot:OHT07637.1 myosin-like antigen [Tritrichomonas foetus]